MYDGKEKALSFLNQPLNEICPSWRECNSDEKRRLFPKQLKGRMGTILAAILQYNVLDKS